MLKFKSFVHLDFLTILPELIKFFWGEVLGESLVSSWGSSWGSSATLSHLDWDTATEGTGTSSVLALNHADVVLASDSTSASLASWDSSLEWEIDSLCVGTAVLAGNLGGDINVGPVTASAVGVDLAAVWAGTVTVDLMESHHDGAALGDLWEGGAIVVHDGLGTGLNIILATTEGLSTSCGIVTLEASGILLEWVPLGSVTWGSWVNSNGGTLSTSITNSLDNGTVASNELGSSEKRKRNGRG